VRRHYLIAQPLIGAVTSQALPEALDEKNGLVANISARAIIP
jgi:hypothetical protein